MGIVAQADIAPSIYNYIGSAAAEINEDFEAGAIKKGKRDGAAGLGDDTCLATLVCDNADSSPSAAERDQQGMIGAVCLHGFPILNSFIPIFTAEQHAYYRKQLLFLLSAGPDIQDVYFDLGCRFRNCFQDIVLKLKSEDPGTFRESYRMRVPWMHGKGHSIRCVCVRGRCCRTHLWR